MTIANTFVDLLSNVEVMKTITFAIVYPIIAACIALRIAKFHFEKDRKVEYLRAKDKVAVDLIKCLCNMLSYMWEIVNIDHWVANGSSNPDLPQRRQRAKDNFYQARNDTTLLLGLMGLYYGTKIVDRVSQLISELNDMVNDNNFVVFDNWDNFRRKRLLPILDKVHKELKYTVFDRPFWDFA